MAQARKVQDKFFKQAKADGYAARSAYKLQEIIRRRRVIKKGDWVLDLGCAPGSWTQVAAEAVGAQGFVLGLDLKPVTIAGLPNARTLVMDVFNATAEGLLADAGMSGTGGGGRGGKDKFDAVISDMAPNTEGGGGRTTDHFRSIELCRKVVELLPKVLRPGGSVVMKVFEGEEYPRLLREVERIFTEAKGFKPEASRDVSREMFIIGLGYEPALGTAVARPPSGIAPKAPAPKSGWGSGGAGGAGGAGGGERQGSGA